MTDSIDVLIRSGIIKFLHLCSCLSHSLANNLIFPFSLITKGIANRLNSYQTFKSLKVENIFFCLSKKFVIISLINPKLLLKQFFPSSHVLRGCAYKKQLLFYMRIIHNKQSFSFLYKILNMSRKRG